MILNVHSDALYLCKPKTKIRADGRFFLSNNAENQRDNGAVLNIAKILNNEMSPAAEAAIGALFSFDPRQVIPTRTALIEMGHQQQPRPI